MLCHVEVYGLTILTIAHLVKLSYYMGKEVLCICVCMLTSYLCRGDKSANGVYNKGKYKTNLSIRGLLLMRVLSIGPLASPTAVLAAPKGVRLFPAGLCTMYDSLTCSTSRTSMVGFPVLTHDAHAHVLVWQVRNVAPSSTPPTQQATRNQAPCRGSVNNTLIQRSPYSKWRQNLGFEMSSAPSTLGAGGPDQNTPRSQNKEV